MDLENNNIEKAPFFETPNFEMLDDKIYSGYRLLEDRKCIEACILWCSAWNDIMYLMDHHEISGISAFDDRFQGIQSVFNWASDFEMELRNAVKDNENFLQTRIDFCNEYIKRSEDKQQLNIENMKSSIAEAYIELGRQKEGDALFESYLVKDPKWGWGWIAWSDCYWIFSENKQNDYQKAEAILKKALIVEGLRDREDVMTRLLDLNRSNAFSREITQTVYEKGADYVDELTDYMEFEDCSQGGDRFAGRDSGYKYTRLGNPNTDEIVTRMAALYETDVGLYTSTGMSAVSTVLLGLLKSGDHFISSD
jgi:tetratricopeptide (TPR) repeat protein